LYETSYDAMVNATGVVEHRYFRFRGKAGARAAARRDRTWRTRLEDVFILAPAHASLPPPRFLPAVSAASVPAELMQSNTAQSVGTRVWAYWDAENQAGTTWPAGFYTALILSHF
jgi:hypothetical protein